MVDQRNRWHPLIGPSWLIWAIALCLSASAGVAPVSAQIFKLPYPDTTSGNFFGNAASIDGDRAIVGASGIDVCGVNSGAAYIYERTPGSSAWQVTARLSASDCAAGRFFGRSVSLSGERILVAASGEFFSTEASNAAYVFEHDPESGEWEEVARLTVNPAEREGMFAASVSLDGDRALITSSGDPVNGSYVGAAYIFERDPESGKWERTARLTGSGNAAQGIFGGSGSLQGDRAVVSASTYFAYRPGSIYIFERDPSSGRWRQAAHFGGIEDFFISVDLDGDNVLVGQSKARPNQSGAATLYSRDDDGTWRLATTLRPKTPYSHGAFGTSVSLDADHALIVGYDEQLGFEFNIDRVVYVFRRNPETDAWTQEHIIDVGDVSFGSSLDQAGGLAVIGKASERHPGSAYVVQIR